MLHQTRCLVRLDTPRFNTLVQVHSEATWGDLLKEVGSQVRVLKLSQLSEFRASVASVGRDALYIEPFCAHDRSLSSLGVQGSCTVLLFAPVEHRNVRRRRKYQAQCPRTYDDATADDTSDDDDDDGTNGHSSAADNDENEESKGCRAVDLQAAEQEALRQRRIEQLLEEEKKSGGVLLQLLLTKEEADESGADSDKQGKRRMRRKKRQQQLQQKKKKALEEQKTTKQSMLSKQRVQRLQQRASGKTTDPKAWESASDDEHFCWLFDDNLVDVAAVFFEKQRAAQQGKSVGRHVKPQAQQGRAADSDEESDEASARIGSLFDDADEAEAPTDAEADGVDGGRSARKVLGNSQRKIAVAPTNIRQVWSFCAGAMVAVAAMMLVGT